MIKKILQLLKVIKPGDWLLISLFSLLVIVSIGFFWNLPQGEYLEIYKNNKLLSTYTLNQKISKKIDGSIGTTEIVINDGRARFSSSPCSKKYCIHQAWINKANQTIICVPNKISISIVGKEKKYGSVNY